MADINKSIGLNANDFMSSINNMISAMERLNRIANTGTSTISQTVAEFNNLKAIFTALKQSVAGQQFINPNSLAAIADVEKRITSLQSKMMSLQKQGSPFAGMNKAFAQTNVGLGQLETNIGKVATQTNKAMLGSVRYLGAQEAVIRHLQTRYGANIKYAPIEAQEQLIQTLAKSKAEVQNFDRILTQVQRGQTTRTKGVNAAYTTLVDQQRTLREVEQKQVIAAIARQQQEAVERNAIRQKNVQAAIASTKEQAHEQALIENNAFDKHEQRVLAAYQEDAKREKAAYKQREQQWLAAQQQVRRQDAAEQKKLATASAIAKQQRDIQQQEQKEAQIRQEIMQGRQQEIASAHFAGEALKNYTYLQEKLISTYEKAIPIEQRSAQGFATIVQNIRAGNLAAHDQYKAIAAVVDQIDQYAKQVNNVTNTQQVDKVTKSLVDNIKGFNRFTTDARIGILLAQQQVGEAFKATILPASQFQDTITQIRAGNADLITQFPPLAGAIRAFDKQVNAATRSISEAWHNFTRLVLARVVTMAFYNLLAVLRQTTQTAIDLSKAIGEIQTISQELPRTNTAWAKSITEVAKRWNLLQLDVAEGVYQTLSNQIAQGTDVIRFLSQAAPFAKATKATLAESVELLSSAMNSFNFTLEELDRVTSVFFKTIELGRVRASEMAQTFGRIAPIAQAIGISFEELMATITVLTRTGLKFERASTFILNVMNKLIKPGKQLTAVFKSWGFASGEAANKILGLPEILRRLAETSGSITELGEEFRDIRATTGINILVQEAKRYASDLETLESGFDSYQRAVSLAMNSAGEIVTHEINKMRADFTSLNKSILETVAAFITFKDGAINLTEIVKTTVALTPAVLLFSRAVHLSWAAIATGAANVSLVVAAIVGLGYVLAKIAKHFYSVDAAGHKFNQTLLDGEKQIKAYRMEAMKSDRAKLREQEKVQLQAIQNELMKNQDIQAASVAAIKLELKEQEKLLAAKLKYLDVVKDLADTLADTARESELSRKTPLGRLVAEIDIIQNSLPQLFAELQQYPDREPTGLKDILDMSKEVHKNFLDIRADLVEADKKFSRAQFAQMNFLPTEDNVRYAEHMWQEGARLLEKWNLVPQEFGPGLLAELDRQEARFNEYFAQVFSRATAQVPGLQTPINPFDLAKPEVAGSFAVQVANMQEAMDTNIENTRQAYEFLNENVKEGVLRLEDLKALAQQLPPEIKEIYLSAIGETSPLITILKSAEEALKHIEELEVQSVKIAKRETPARAQQRVANEIIGLGEGGPMAKLLAIAESIQEKQPTSELKSALEHYYGFRQKVAATPELAQNSAEIIRQTGPLLNDIQKALMHTTAELPPEKQKFWQLLDKVTAAGTIGQPMAIHQRALKYFLTDVLKPYFVDKPFSENYEQAMTAWEELNRHILNPETVFQNPNKVDITTPVVNMNTPGMQFARGGSVNGPKGTDTVPAWLTPGEFVINRRAAQQFAPLLQHINASGYARGGYIYNDPQLLTQIRKMKNPYYHGTKAQPTQANFWDFLRALLGLDSRERLGDRLYHRRGEPVHFNYQRPFNSYAQATISSFQPARHMSQGGPVTNNYQISNDITLTSTGQESIDARRMVTAINREVHRGTLRLRTAQ